jgi:hypothetical protein
LFNLISLAKGRELAAIGYEANAEASRQAVNHGIEVLRKIIPKGLSLKFAEAELMLSVGFLIHIPPKDYQRVLNLMETHSRRWILIGENESDKEETILYRGQKNALWKRPYKNAFPNLKLINSWENPEGWDRVTFHLWSKE